MLRTRVESGFKFGDRFINIGDIVTVSYNAHYFNFNLPACDKTITGKVSKFDFYNITLDCSKKYLSIINDIEADAITNIIWEDNND